LKENKCLVGNRLTIADFVVVTMLIGTFKIFHKVLHVDYPSMAHRFYGVYNLPIFKQVAGEIELLDMDFPIFPSNERAFVNTAGTKEKQIEASEMVAA
jgi:elongation factor 1-gamma